MLQQFLEAKNFTIDTNKNSDNLSEQWRSKQVCEYLKIKIYPVKKSKLSAYKIPFKETHFKKEEIFKAISIWSLYY